MVINPEVAKTTFFLPAHDNSSSESIKKEKKIFQKINSPTDRPTFWMYLFASLGALEAKSNDLESNRLSNGTLVVSVARLADNNAYLLLILTILFQGLISNYLSFLHFFRYGKIKNE